MSYGIYSLAGVRGVRLDASTVCQLKCPVCPTGTGITVDSPVGKGFLLFDHFRHFVDNNRRIRFIELSNYGEIFLNPELLDILKYAHEKKFTSRHLMV